MSEQINVILAPLSGRTVCTTKTVYQYNSGMILKLTGIDLPTSYVVDFANSVTGSSISQVGDSSGVPIPDQFFTPGSTIHAWFVAVGTGYSVTRYHIMIPISPRAVRTNEEPTPSQQSALDEAIVALNGAVGTATAAAEDARLHERMAADCATLAETAASHYPRINAGYWEIWDVESGAYVSTGVQAQGTDWQDPTTRVTSLDETGLAGPNVIETVGIPAYVSSVAQYSAYGLTDTGWYVFARIAAPDGVTVSSGTAITGAAGYIATYGEDHVDVAVKFEVAAQSQAVTVTWTDGDAETFVFRSSDLAVRNLDYRTTFYVYDLAPYAAWTYALTTDATFVAGKNYYTEENGVYSLAEVTAGEAVTANTYYNHSKLTLSGMVKNVTYRLDEPLDCALEIALPEINEDGHGAWFEFQLRHTGSTSITLLPHTGVKGATAGASAAITAGLNVVDLHYTDVDGVKMWSLANVHTNIPA